jgi:hypothetical protein
MAIAQVPRRLSGTTGGGTSLANGTVMLIEGDRLVHNHRYEPDVSPPPPPPPPEPYREQDGVDPVKQEPAFFAPPPPPLPQPPSEPPHQALDRIEALPRPSSAGIPRGLPPEDRQSLMDERKADYHRQRLALAEAALKSPQPPRPEDFRGGGLNAATASHEYQEARTAHSAQLSELQSIARESRHALYPPRPLDAQQNLTLTALGVKLPDPPTTDDLSAAHELLKQLPQDTAAHLFGIGKELTFGKQVKLAPGMEASIKGSTELTNERTGPGFEKSHKLSIELEVTSGLSLSKSPRPFWQRKALEQLEKLDNLSPEARKLIGRAKGGLVHFEYEKQVGGRFTVEAKITPEQARKIDAGELAVPNPFDPVSMPTGTSMLIKGQALQSTSMDLGYRLFQTESGVTELDGFGIGVEKLDEEKVRVTTGPVATVENEVFVGLGTGDFKVGLGGETTLEGTHMRTAEFDLASAEGRQAYQEFLRTGVVPNSLTPGVEKSGRIDTLSMDSKGFAELKIGSFGGRAEFGSSEGERRTVTWDNGRKDETLYLRYNDRAMQIRRELDAEGDVVPGSAQYKIVGADTHPACAGYAQMAFTNLDKSPSLKGNKDVQITMTESDLLEIRRRAQDFVKAHPSGMPSLEQTIAESKDADEVAMWLVRHGVDGSMNSVFEDLVGLRASTDGRAPLPGRIEMQG